MRGRIARCTAGAVLCSILAGASAAQSASPEAEAHWHAGLAHLLGHKPRYEEAYKEFKAAYAASQAWTVLGNLGVAAHHIERYGEAIDAFEEYLSRGGSKIPADEAEQVREDLAALRSEMATVTFSFRSEQFWIIDTRVAGGGKPVVNQYGPFRGSAELRVRAGHHRFQVTRSDADVPTWAVDLREGEHRSHDFELASAQQPPASPNAETVSVDLEQGSAGPPLGSYILWGIAAAGFGATTVLYVRAADLQKEADAQFESNCPQGVVAGNPLCASTTPADARAADWRTGALLTGIGSAAALTAGTILWLTDRDTPSSSTARSAIRSRAGLAHDIRPWVGLGGIGVMGVF